MKLKELQDKRNQLAAEIRKMADAFNANGKAWKDDAERSAWEKLNADYDANLKELEAEQARETTAKSVEDRLAALSEQDERSRNHGVTIPGLEDTRGRWPIGGDDGSQISEETRALALSGWFAGERRSDRQAQAMQALSVRAGNELTISLLPTRQFRDLQEACVSVHETRRLQAMREVRALSAQGGAAGGYTFGETFVRNIERAMLAFGGVNQVAQIIRTPTGEPMRWPTANDTANSGRQIGDSQAVTTLDPTFGQVMWNAYKYTSDEILVPFELTRESYFDLETILGDMLGERLGRIQNTKNTLGTGAGQAKGIVVCAASGVTSASSTAIAYDEVIDLEHALDPSRRNLPGVGYMFHDNVLKALRKLKDGEGRYLWQSGANGGTPDLLNNRTYTINQDMASSIVSGAITMLFGQLSMYKVRQVGQMRLYRLVERYRENDQDAFLAFIEGDGNLLNAGDNPVKKLVQV